MIKRYHFFLSLVAFFVLVLLCAIFPAAAPDAPVQSDATLSLLQTGDFPFTSDIPAKAEISGAENRAYLTFFRTGTNLSEATEVIRSGLLAMSPSISLRSYSLTVEQLKSILQELINSSPELFHVGKQYQYYISGSVIDSLLPTYTCTAEEYAARSAVYETEISALLSLHSTNWSAAETVLFYHDYLALHYSYDLTEPYNYDAYSFLTEKTGVCQAYALTFTALMQRLDIECAYVQSEAMLHIWNVVQIDGEWYHIDITWDDPTPDRPGQVLHSLLLLSDSAMQAADHHSWVVQNKAVCSSTRYDNAAWRNVAVPLAYSNQRWYGIDRTSGAIAAYNFANGAADSAVYTISDKWTTASGSTYVHKYAGLVASNSLLFFSTPTVIQALDPISGMQTDVLSIDPQKGSIYGLWADGGRLYYTIASDYSAAGEVFSLPIPELSVPDYSLNVHLYDRSGFLSSYPTISDAIGAMNDPTQDYIIGLHSETADTPVSCNVLRIPSEKANTITIRPLGETDAVQLVMNASLTLGCDLSLERIALTTASTSASLSLGSHKLTLSDGASVGSVASPIHITGGSGSALDLLAARSELTINGSVDVESVNLRGALSLQGTLQSTVLHIPSAAVITFHGQSDALTSSQITGSNELTLLPIGSRPPIISVAGTADVLLRYRYSYIFDYAPLLTAPSLSENDITVWVEAEGIQTDVTSLFAIDSTGTVRLDTPTKMTISGGILTDYLSVIANERVEIPESVSEIASFAFANAPGVIEVLIPASVQTVSPQSVGYVYQNGSLARLAACTILTEEGSSALTYAKENDIAYAVYQIENDDGFTYRYYPTLRQIEFLAWEGTGSFLIIPQTFTAEDGTVCETSVRGNLAAGHPTLSLFSYYPTGSDRCPFEALWQKTNSYYPLSAWHSLTLMLEDTVLRRIPLPINSSPAAELITPTYPAGFDQSYHFIGWDADGDGIPDLIPSAMEEDLTLYAIFEKLENQVVIFWYNDDGTLLFSQTLDRGTVIEPPAAPIKPATASHEYLFLAWSGYELGMTAEENCSFTAAFTSKLRTFTYTFLDDDGTPIVTQTADYGTAIPLPASPTKPSDSQYRYTFSHWEGYGKNQTLTEDLTFTAVYIRLQLGVSHPTDITSSHYPIAFGYITRVEPGTTVSQLLSRLNENAYLTIRDQNGAEILDADRAAATGMTIHLLAPDGETVLKSVTVCVIGDLTQDGAVTVTDFLRLQAHLLGIDPLTGAPAEAADMSGDDRITVTDFLQLKTRLLSA